MSINFKFRHWRSTGISEESSDGTGDEGTKVGIEADNRKERQKKLIRASSFPASTLLCRLSLTSNSFFSAEMPSLNPQAVRASPNLGVDKMANCIRTRPTQWKRVQETNSEAHISQSPFNKQVWRVVVMGSGMANKPFMIFDKKLMLIIAVSE